MQSITTLSQLLDQSDCQYQVYDLGRRIQRIENQWFANVESGYQAYPYPLQQKAKFAIVYWNENNQPWFWFLNFELDERGQLKPGDVGQFIRYVVEAMGSRLSGKLDEAQQEKLSNNPYTFKPSEEKLASLNSLVRVELSLPASQYYEHAQSYFKGELGWDNWQTVGIQGITDLAARLSAEQNHRTVLTSIKHLPTQPLYALLGALEHVSLTKDLSKKIAEFTEVEMDSEQPDLFLLAALIRTLSGAQGNVLNELSQTLLSSPSLCHPEVLVGLAGRSWSVLADSGRAELFLIRLAQTQDQTLFNQLFADLVMIPELRMVMLPLLNSTPSPELVKALEELQNHTLSKH